jgi:hypothetical protein
VQQSLFTDIKQQLHRIQEPSTNEMAGDNRIFRQWTGDLNKDDEIEMICHEILSGKPQTSHIHIPFDLTPHICLDKIVRIQWSLTNKMVTQMFLQPGQYHIKSHAIIIEKTFFLGSGNLVLGLQQALFDANNLDGLKLDTNRQWPPSGGEINRTLSQLIEDDVSSLSDICEEVRDQNVVNFGLNLSSAVASSLNDGSSIWATDILHLVYNTKKPLLYILNSRFLTMCNAIFKRLLRLLRILHVMKNQSYWEKSYMEARNFVNCYSSYVHSIVLPGCWHRVYKYLEELDDGHENQGSVQRLMDLFSRTVKKIVQDLLIDDEAGDLVDTVFGKLLRKEQDIHEDIINIMRKIADKKGLAEEFVANLGYQESLQ